jgi:hypothetical protein
LHHATDFPRVSFVVKLIEATGNQTGRRENEP